MFVYCTPFVRDSFLCNLPDTLNSNNFPPDFCHEEYFTQSSELETTPRPVCDSNWSFLHTKRHTTTSTPKLSVTKDSNPAENFAFSHENYFLFRFFIVHIKSYLVSIFLSDDGIVLTRI